MLPALRYDRVKRFESGGRGYERLGIRFFKRFVPNGACINQRIRLSDPGYRVVRDERAILRFEGWTRIAERSHLVSLLLVLPGATYALMLGWEWFALGLLLPNIPLHLYPILLQRYSRARIQRVLERERRDGRPGRSAIPEKKGGPADV